MSEWKSMEPEDFNENIFHLVGNEWMLIAAGDSEKWNAMTASWGGLGILWNKRVCSVYVRPSRFTYQFLEDQENFTLSFFHKTERGPLSYCGTHSGSSVNKMESAGLTLCSIQENFISFNEARLQIHCHKTAFLDFTKESILAPEVFEHYPQDDFHRMYVGEIKGIYQRLD
jgi:flavin reductase (DIM6/NTAB) family NADH-FMN oxidoreductase RutF